MMPHTETPKVLLPVVVAVSAHDYATDLGARDASASAVDLRATDTLVVPSAHWGSAGSAKPRLAVGSRQAIQGG